MARPLSTLLLSSLLFLSTSITLGHGMPHIFQDTNDGSEGMVEIGDMLVPQSLYQRFFNSSYMAPRKGYYDTYLWPREGGVPTVPYEYADVTYKSEIEAGMRHWEEHTCLTFRPKTDTDTHWLTFIRDNGCYSLIGRHTANQSVSIGKGCESLRTVAHELGHAIGLLHEQMRSDRDDYVVILWQNIDSDNQNNFDKLTIYEGNRGVPYDYTSIMHYGGRDFSANGRSTIATTQPEHQGLLRKVQELTHRDKHIVNIMYECIDQWQAACSSAVTCEGEGYLGRDCTCVCPPGTQGDRCEVNTGDYYADNLPECSRNITTEITFTSPNYPDNIPSGTWCVYKVEAPEGQVPEVTFHSFNFYDSSRCWDFLEVRTTDIHDGEVFCGTDITEGHSFRGTSRDLYLYMDTSTALSQGFQAEVKFSNSVSPVSSSMLAVLMALLVVQVYHRF